MLSEYHNLCSTRDQSLAADIRNTVCNLAISLDACVSADEEVHPYLECVLSFCLANLLQQSAKEQAILATECMAVVLSAARTNESFSDLPILHALHRSAAGNISSIVQLLLGILPAGEGVYNAVGTILAPLLAAVESRHLSPVDILGHIANAMPNCNVPAADRLFLMVVDELLSRSSGFGQAEPAWQLNNVAQRVVQCLPFVDLVKRSVLSDEVYHRAAVTKVICRLCRACAQVAEMFCELGVFEYLVESIRAVGSQESNAVSTEGKRLSSCAIEAAAAIVEQNPSGLSEKWCYCLDVFLAVCEYFSEGEQAQHISAILDHAFRSAPLPAFSHSLIDKVATYEMMICTHMLQARDVSAKSADRSCQHDDVLQYEALFEHGILFLTNFLQRYSPSTASLHSLLRICETAVQPNQPFRSILGLAVQITNRFIALYQEPGEKEGSIVSEELQSLGERLLFIYFDTWASTLEGFLGDFEKQLHTSDFVLTLILAADLLCYVFDPIFLLCGACSNDDQDSMRRWCWKFLPPRSVFCLSLQLSGVSTDESALNTCEEYSFEVLRRYLWSISIMPLQAQGGALEDCVQCIETTEQSFLASLADCDDRDGAAFHMFKTSVQLDLLDSLCPPELLANALCSRLKRWYHMKGKEIISHCLDIGRGVSLLCSRFGLRFQLFGIASEILGSMMRNGGYCIENPNDFTIFQQVILGDVQDSVDTYAWEKFAIYVLARDVDSRVGEKIVWSMLSEHSNVVKSMIFALSESTQPQVIADSLLKLADDHDGARKLIKSFEQAGANDILTNLLTTIHSAAGTHSKSHGSVQKFSLECQRISSFISILSRELSGSVTAWSLTCLVCDIFVREATVAVENPGSWLLLSNLLRWLIASLSNRTEKGIESYIRQSDVIPQVIHILRVPFSSTANIFQDQCISAGACFVILLIRKELVIDCPKDRIELLCDFAGDQSAWERLFNSFSFLVERDPAFKLTNCCHLLKCLLTVPSVEKYALVTACSGEIITLLTTAACSRCPFLEEIALNLLTVAMKLVLDKPNNYCSSSIQLQLSAKKLNKVCSATASFPEWKYVEAALSLGHLDDVLRSSQLRVRTRIKTLVKETSSKQKAPHKHSVEMIESMNALLSAIDERWSKIEHQVIVPNSSLNIPHDPAMQTITRPIPIERGHSSILLGRNYILAFNEVM